MTTPAFQFYPQDFLVGTAEMTPFEVGIYIRLLCYQWSKGGLPDDDSKLAALAGCDGNAVASVRHKFGICDDGKLRNARMELVRADQVDYRARQAKNALKGWEKRRSAMPRQCDGNATATPTNTPKACPSPSPSEKVNLPTLEQVISFGQTNAGASEEMASKFFYEHQKRPLAPSGNWTDRNGTEVANWRMALCSYALTWRQNDSERRFKAHSRSEEKPRQKFVPVAPDNMPEENLIEKLERRQREREG